MAPAVAATLGFAAGLSLEAAMRVVSVESALRAGGADPFKFALKWPNDVLAGGQKLSGILLEAEAVSTGLAVVVGIGTNVMAAPEGTPTPATSLKALGIDVSAEDLFAELSDAWAEFRAIWDDGGGFSEINFGSAHLSAAQPAGLRIDELYAIGPQLRNVSLHGWLLPHRRVHRRRHQFAAAKRQVESRKQIVCQSMRCLGQKIRRRWRHDKQFGSFGESDMGA